MNKGGFSWKRLSGLSAAKSKVSRTIGIPLTKSGRQRKVGAMLGSAAGMAVLASGIGSRKAPADNGDEEVKAPSPKGGYRKGCGCMLILVAVYIGWTIWSGYTNINHLPLNLTILAGVLFLMGVAAYSRGRRAATPRACPVCTELRLYGGDDLCPVCAQELVKLVEINVPDIKNLQLRAERARDPQTKIDYLQQAISAAEEFLYFEEAGINVMTPAASELIGKLQEEIDRISGG